MLQRRCRQWRREAAFSGNGNQAAPSMHCTHRMLASMQFSNRDLARQLRSPSIRASAHARSGGACMVKICGVTNAEDAQVAAQAGADFVGMIMWPKAKRSVSDQTAKLIADTVKRDGALPVGVFVDESPEVIIERCNAAGIPVAQLHGDKARAGLQALQGCGLQLVYVMHADKNGQLVTPLPPPGTCDWLLIDGMQGGSGQALNWSALQPPQGLARKGWLLAGGLNPATVATAIHAMHPSGVDVSSGVCGPDGLKKVPASIHAFIRSAKEAGQVATPQA